MKKIGFLVTALLLVSLSGCRAFHRWNADFVNDNKQEYLVQDARGRLANYEWFYDQYAAIEATRQKIKILEGQPEQTGVKMVLASMIEEYNSRSR